MKLTVSFIAATLVGVALAVGYAGEGRRPPGGFGGLGGFGGDLRQLPFATGRVTAVNQKTITVETPTGSRAIAVTDKTKFTKQVEGKAADVKKGAWVSVTGTLSADGKTIEARFITISPPLLSPPRMDAMRRPRSREWTSGQVAGASSLTVKTSDGKSVTVQIKKGAQVTVIGTPSADGKTIEARTVTINIPQIRGFSSAIGEVTNTSPLTVKTYEESSVVVKTTPETKVTMTKNVTLADVKKDDFIVVNGKPGANGVLEAETVRVNVGFGGRPGRFDFVGGSRPRPGGAVVPRQETKK